uniref:Uncharacterized protein n=1 Tax=Triticum urartu TaxID=4572 RepID=A0A8R7JZP8_TRIUA
MPMRGSGTGQDLGAFVHSSHTERAQKWRSPPRPPAGSPPLLPDHRRLRLSRDTPTSALRTHVAPLLHSSPPRSPPRSPQYGGHGGAEARAAAGGAGDGARLGGQPRPARGHRGGHRVRGGARRRGGGTAGPRCARRHLEAVLHVCVGRAYALRGGRETPSPAGRANIPEI